MNNAIGLHCCAVRPSGNEQYVRTRGLFERQIDHPLNKMKGEAKPVNTPNLIDTTELVQVGDISYPCDISYKKQTHPCGYCEGYMVQDPYYTYGRIMYTATVYLDGPGSVLYSDFTM
jgi:hypothetical protein